MPADRPLIRSEFVADFVEQTIEGMNECGLNPIEGITAAEMIMFTLIDNALKGSTSDVMLNASKAQAARMLSRLLARVEAWPADTSRRN